MDMPARAPADEGAPWMLGHEQTTLLRLYLPAMLYVALLPKLYPYCGSWLAESAMAVTESR